MHRSRYLEDVVVWAPAKVNLHLEVLGKRPDGYHAIETLMATIRLYDTLVFRADPGGDVRLACNWKDLSTGPGNLVMRAAARLRERTGYKGGARIRLVKRIPTQAGLAGGSTDAAATLAGLNDLWGLGLTVDELAAIGADLGSDVPFFFRGPAAWCTGRGEIVEPLTVGRPLDLVLLLPAFGLPTGPVYANVTVPAAPKPGDAIRHALAAGDGEAVGRELHNRLQPAAATIDPRIDRYAEVLERTRPAGRLMSGSGSALFAVARDRADAERIADDVRRAAGGERYRVMIIRGCA